MYVLVFIVPHVDIELEDNKQFISNIPRNNGFLNITVILMLPDPNEITIMLIQYKAVFPFNCQGS